MLEDTFTALDNTHVNRKQHKLYRYLHDVSRRMTCSFILCTNSCWTLRIMTRRQWQVPYIHCITLPALLAKCTWFFFFLLYAAKASSFRVCLILLLNIWYDFLDWESARFNTSTRTGQHRHRENAQVYLWDKSDSNQQFQCPNDEDSNKHLNLMVIYNSKLIGISLQ
jgi:hypothetical protein